MSKTQQQKYEGKYICGYCKKVTSISNNKVEDIIQKDQMDYAICSCGHFSYASSIKAKFKADFSKWRRTSGRSK